ncbi:hypothetical protein D3C84_995730 [compost metagenome]
MGQHLHRALRGAISEGGAGRLLVVNGADEDHASAASIRHTSAECLGTEEGGFRIALHHFDKFRFFAAFDSSRSYDAAIVNHDVNGAKQLLGLIQHRR